MTDNKDTRPLCAECLEKGLKVYMGKAGGGVSGKRRCQSYRCSRCLATWLNTKEVYIKKQFRSKVVQRK